MSQSTPVDNQSVDTTTDSTANLMETFVSTVTDALDDCGADDTVVDRVETIGGELADSVRDDHDQRDDERDSVARQVAEVRSSVHDVRQTVEDDETGDEPVSTDETPTPHGAKTGPHKAVTPLERVTRMDESTADSSLSRNQDRARAVFRDVLDYTQSVPKGRAIATPDLRKVLTAFRENGSACYKTVSRVVDFLTEMGKGDVWTKERMNGDTVVVFSEDICRRRASYQNQSSAGDAVVTDTEVTH